MKTIRVMQAKQYFRKFFFPAFAVVMCGCSGYDKFQITEKPYVDRTSVELYIGEGSGERGSIRLKSSPEGRQYVWTSLDPEVATVDQTGLVTALREGFAVITVASGNDQTGVNVWVRNWIPFTGFTLSYQQRVIKSWKDRFQIIATAVPQNASDPQIRWTSSNPNVATVLENGWVMCNESGTAVITASAAGIDRTVEVVVTEMLPRTNWEFPGYSDGSQDGQTGYSSQATNAGASPQGRVIAMIDGDLNSFWHACFNPVTDYPHWFIVKLNRNVEIHGVMLQRRQGSAATAKGYRLYTCAGEPTDPSDPVNGYAWEDRGEFTFNPAINDAQTTWLSSFPTARYVKMYFDVSHKGTTNYTMFAEFALYGKVVE